MAKAPHYIFDSSDPYDVTIAGMRYSAPTEEAAKERLKKELREWRALGYQYRNGKVIYRRTGEVIAEIATRDIDP